MVKPDNDHKRTLVPFSCSGVRNAEVYDAAQSLFLGCLERARRALGLEPQQVMFLVHFQPHCLLKMHLVSTRVCLLDFSLGGKAHACTRAHTHKGKREQLQHHMT